MASTSSPDISKSVEAATEAPPTSSRIVTSMPRRKQIGVRSSTPENGEMQFRRVILKASFSLMVKRFVFWNVQLFRLLILNGMDKLRFRGSTQTRARRLRETLQTLGPTAIKFGQQLSQRADVLDPAYCTELGRLLDNVPPFPLEQAVKVLEETYHRPLSEVFRRFDPKPIGSASISCVYQAELISGETVAVKIRRPGIVEIMVADLSVMSLEARFMEALGIVRPGVATSFTAELKRMLVEELDFGVEARFTELFRKESKKNGRVSAPRLYPDLCTEQILVSEFVSGAFLVELLAAVSKEHNGNGNGELAALQARGYDVTEISKNLLYVFFWEVFESNFFHADPHPANIIVKPDNTLIMIDFGSCGTVSNKFRRNLMDFYSLLEKEDLNGMCRKMLTISEPLPPIDTDRCMEELLNLIRTWFFALRSKNSKWQEKCSGAMFLQMISLCGRYGISSKPESVRFFRANFLYDSMIYRLHPQLNGPKQFQKYFESFAKRTRKRVRRAMLQRMLGPKKMDYVTMEGAWETGTQMIDRIRDYLEVPKFSYSEGVGKLAYTCSLSLKTAINLFFLTVLFSGGRMVYLLAHRDSGAELLLRCLIWTAKSGLFHFVVLFVLIIVVRKLLIRLDSIDLRD
jgi:ubiquinone biosynthesis protein